MSNDALKSIGTGVSTYIAALKNYYVDKTLFIRDVIDRDWQVSLITRPRRFGKSLNMDMLKTFFEISGEDTSRYFRDKKIWGCGKKYQDEQGKYPVIFISLAEAGCQSWDYTYDILTGIISAEFYRHRELATSSELGQSDIDLYNRIVNKTASWGEYALSLKSLSRMLNDHYKRIPVILIDEYDAPIKTGYDHRYYGKAMDFIKGFMSSGLKNNPSMEFAVLMGVLLVSGQSLFSGLNSFDPYSVLSDRYAEYFGFTRDEVREMLAYYGAEDKYDEVCEWYDGYVFGNTEIFNPWSVLYYIKKHFVPALYWVNTAENSDVGKLLKKATPETASKIHMLMDGDTITAKVNENLTYSALMNNRDNVFTLLLYYGYLKATGENTSYMSMYECSRNRKIKSNHYYYLTIPNEEVASVFEDEVSDQMLVSENEFDAMWDIIEHFDEHEIEDGMRKFIEDSVSYHDYPYEEFYSGFVICMCKYKKDEYFVEPQRNSGKGRTDISMEPRISGKPGIIIELERIKSGDSDTLKKAADAGLKQIVDNDYDTVLRNHGITDIVKIGMAFCGSSVRVSIAR